MSNHQITAIEMAKQHGLDPKRFREALRDEGLSWHRPNEKWTVVYGSQEHEDMCRVLSRLLK